METSVPQLLVCLIEWAEFFSNMTGAASITVWLSDSIILYETCANQFSVFKEM
jgi:hypothetical protein